MHGPYCTKVQATKSGPCVGSRNRMEEMAGLVAPHFEDLDSSPNRAALVVTTSPLSVPATPEAGKGVARGRGKSKGQGRGQGPVKGRGRAGKENLKLSSKNSGKSDWYLPHRLVKLPHQGQGKCRYCGTKTCWYCICQGDPPMPLKGKRRTDVEISQIMYCCSTNQGDCCAFHFQGVPPSSKASSVNALSMTK